MVRRNPALRNRGGPARVVLIAALAAAVWTAAAPRMTGSQPRMTGAQAMQQMRYLQRSSGAGSISPLVWIEARNKIEEMHSLQRDAGLWTWTWLGPGNIGGRIRSILTHPTDANRLWVGGASGGIWTTTNGGTSWSVVDDFMGSLCVTSMIMDPTNPSVMYAATGEGSFQGSQVNATAVPGAGIFRSTNAGVTWNQLASTANWGFVNKLAHSPFGGNTLYACSFQPRGVWRSTDSGTSWTQVLQPPNMPTDIEIHPTVPGLVFVGCSYGGTVSGGVYRATDGVNFTELTTSAGLFDLPDDTGRCEIDLNPGVVYVLLDRNRGEVWKSTQSGAPGTWLFCSNPDILGGIGGYANALWADPTNANRLVIGGLDVHRSTDGGINWTQISSGTGWINGTCPHPDQHEIIPHTGYNGSTNRIVYEGNDGGLIRADDIWTASTSSGWTWLNNNLGITQFYAGAASPDGSLILGGTQDNGLPRVNGGNANSWSRTPLYLDGGFCAVNYDTPSIVYGSTQYLHVWKSTNGGASYADAITGLADASNASNSLFIAPLVMDPNTPSILAAGSKRLWKTTNGAASWTQMRGDITGSPFCTAIGIKPGNSNEIWAGYHDGTVSRSTNGGVSWTNLDENSPGLPNRWVMDIAVSPHFASEAVVTFSGFNADNVWATIDGGATWLQRTGTAPNDLPALPVNSVSYHPTNPDWMYLGTDLGIFASEDFGANWNVTPRYAENDGPAYVEVDDLIWYGDNLVAVTFGRGMYRSRPLDAVYVDQAYSGPEDGSMTRPYNTITEGIAASGNGTNLSIRSATYAEGTALFNRRGLVVATGGTVTVR